MSTNTSTDHEHIASAQTALSAAGLVSPQKLADTLQGQIWSVTKSSTKQKYVVKATRKELHHEKTSIIDGKSYAVNEDILKEARILKYLHWLPQRPTSIISYKGAFSSHQHYFLVMEHGGNSLFAFIQKAHRFLQMKKIEPSHWMKVVRCIFKQMVEAIAFLHAHNICHFDVSIENFTLCKDLHIVIENIGTQHEKLWFADIERDLQIKLIDFGLAEMFQIDEKEQELAEKPRFVSNKFVGKRNYESPEIRERKHFDAAANDIWCVGVCLFMMAAGCQPWAVAEESDASFKLIYVHKRLKQVLSLWHRAHLFDEHLLHLIERLFQPEVDRISLAQIQAHPWLNDERHATDINAKQEN